MPKTNKSFGSEIEQRKKFYFVRNKQKTNDGRPTIARRRRQMVREKAR